VKIFDGGAGAILLNDEEVILMVQKGKIAAYALEKLLKDHERAVAIRRALICTYSPVLAPTHSSCAHADLPRLAQLVRQPATRSNPPSSLTSITITLA
jgi:hypothetical protein